MGRSRGGSVSLSSALSRRSPRRSGDDRAAAPLPARMVRRGCQQLAAAAGGLGPLGGGTPEQAAPWLDGWALRPRTARRARRQLARLALRNGWTDAARDILAIIPEARHAEFEMVRAEQAIEEGRYEAARGYAQSALGSGSPDAARYLDMIARARRCSSRAGRLTSVRPGRRSARCTGRLCVAASSTSSRGRCPTTRSATRSAASRSGRASLRPAWSRISRRSATSRPTSA